MCEEFYEHSVIDASPDQPDDEFGPATSELPVALGLSSSSSDAGPRVQSPPPPHVPVSVYKLGLKWHHAPVDPSPPEASILQGTFCEIFRLKPNMGNIVPRYCSGSKLKTLSTAGKGLLAAALGEMVNNISGDDADWEAGPEDGDGQAGGADGDIDPDNAMWEDTILGELAAALNMQMDQDQFGDDDASQADGDLLDPELAASNDEAAGVDSSDTESPAAPASSGNDSPAASFEPVVEPAEPVLTKQALMNALAKWLEGLEKSMEALRHRRLTQATRTIGQDRELSLVGSSMRSVFG